MMVLRVLVIVWACGVVPMAWWILREIDRGAALRGESADHYITRRYTVIGCLTLGVVWPAVLTIGIAIRLAAALMPDDPPPPDPPSDDEVEA